ncbi:MAG: ABC transporter ATP-binding protein/permease [Nitrososphaera sp.]|nr:ABC transporter ATP-binding protein/permease [Nitrososphaera sp.]
MIDIINKTLKLLLHRERWSAMGLLVAIMVTSLLDLLGVASILPFMSLLSQPEIIERNEWMQKLYYLLGFSSTHSFLIFLGLVVLILVVSNNVFLAFTTWLTERFVWAKHHALSKQLLETYLSRPYIAFLNRNSAELGKTVLLEVYYFTRSVLASILQLVASLVSIITISALLILVDSILTLVMAITIGGAYAAVYAIFRRTMVNTSHKRERADRNRFKTVNEALSGIKDIKILGRESHFVRRYTVVSREFSNVMITRGLVQGLPRYALETLSFGSLLLIVLYLMALRGDVRQIIPIVGVYAFAGYRLMPSFKAIFKSLADMRFQQATVEIIFRELTESMREPYHELLPTVLTEPLIFEKCIEFQDVTFTYPGAPRPAIQSICLTIPYKRSIALVGPTGAGKTTIVDIMLGLFMPEKGTVRVDGICVNQTNLHSWQRILGYVPQSIFLADDTITRNIAFGVDDESINLSAVEQAARIANLHDFIIDELSNGYETVIGERGVRLSGGQRQRIGIARALYHDPDVLVLDEATSALDGITEEAVLKAIENIAKTKTLIMIAHRLSTVRDCSMIYLLEGGRIVAQGAYDELVRSNYKFRAMAQLATVP